MALEISDSSSFEQSMVNKKPYKKCKNHHLPAWKRQETRPNSQDTLSEVQHHTLPRAYRPKAQGHSVALDQMKTSNTSWELSSLSATSDSRIFDRERADLREELLREVPQRHMSRSEEVIPNLPAKSTYLGSTGINQSKTTASQATFPHIPPFGQNETDLASKLNTSPKGCKPKTLGPSVARGRVKTSNRRSRLFSLSAKPGSRISTRRKGANLREALLREVLQRHVSRSAISITSLPAKSTGSNLSQTIPSQATVHYVPPFGQEESDFASEDDYVKSGSTYSLNSIGSSPQHRQRRNSGSMYSIPESLLGTAVTFRDIFMSERSEHRKMKAFVGFVFGFILGIGLYMVLDFALEYEWKAALIITSVASLFMAISLALTVRARCVAVLMIPTLCTSQGRAAIYAIIVALLLGGPIQNIYINAEVTSNSISCGAEMTVNISNDMQRAYQEVLERYVSALNNSVGKLRKVVDTVDDIFKPIDSVVGELNDKLKGATKRLHNVTYMCDDALGSIPNDCQKTFSSTYHKCKQRTKKRPLITHICEVLNIGETCKILDLTSVCQFPSAIGGFVGNTAGNIVKGYGNLREMMAVNIDFSTYLENRQWLNGSVKAIREAVKEDIQSTRDIILTIFSVADKILASSLLWLAIRSYNYYWKFCTKDKFDNFYITQAFINLDEHRKSEGKQHLLPLKKSERQHYVDLSSVGLGKRERGLFKLGLANVFMHATVAGLIIVVDYGFYWLLALIREHGQFQYNFEAVRTLDLDIEGTGIMSHFVRWMFSEGFNTANGFNVTIDTNECLPTPSRPHQNTAIAVGVLYIFTLLTVLCQAYLLRLRRFIASYYFPEREIERTLYLYNETLNKRNNFCRLLRRYMKQNKKEMDYQNQVSINAYLMRNYPCWGKLMRKLGFYNKYCQGCKDKNTYGNFKKCSSKACECIYCSECARGAEYVCVCNEFLDDYTYKTTESKG